jgi:DNA-binding NtrC family response regulator
MKPTLLIADGDAELCELYQFCLTKCGYKVATASDGLDCLEKLHRVMPAVLVLDRDLHWGGGDGVLAWLREEGAPFRVPVVLTATDSYPPVVAEAVQPPVVTFLPKPFALAALLESVRAAAGTKGHEEPFIWNRAAGRPVHVIG